MTAQRLSWSGKFSGAVAEFDKAMVVAKLKGARDRVRRTKGKCEGRKSYAEREGGHELIDMARWLRSNAEVVRIRCAKSLPNLLATDTSLRVAVPMRPPQSHPCSLTNVERTGKLEQSWAEKNPSIAPLTVAMNGKIEDKIVVFGDDELLPEGRTAEHRRDYADAIW
jgi:hypothetical protein